MLLCLLVSIIPDVSVPAAPIKYLLGTKLVVVHSIWPVIVTKISTLALAKGKLSSSPPAIYILVAVATADKAYLCFSSRNSALYH